MGKNRTLETFKMMYGTNVMCTNGLYHIIDNDHKEIYINAYTKQIDRRGKYRTIAVLDDIILAEVVSIAKIKYVILNKYTLKTIYKTQGIIKYLDNNLMYSVCGGKTELISHTGKVICKIYNVQDIKALPYNRYLLKSKIAFSDRILYYDRYNIHLLDLTEDRKYIIDTIGFDNDKLIVTFMHGSKYDYNFKTGECFNRLTREVEENTFLWKML